MARKNAQEHLPQTVEAQRVEFDRILAQLESRDLRETDLELVLKTLKRDAKAPNWKEELERKERKRTKALALVEKRALKEHVQMHTLVEGPSICADPANCASNSRVLIVHARFIAELCRTIAKADILPEKPVAIVMPDEVASYGGAISFLKECGLTHHQIAFLILWNGENQRPIDADSWDRAAGASREAFRNHKEKLAALTKRFRRRASQFDPVTSKTPRS